MLDFTNPLSPKRIFILSNAFSERSYYNRFANTNPTKLIVDWIEKDTVMRFDTSDYFCRSCKRVIIETAIVNDTKSLGKYTESPILGVSPSSSRLCIVKDRLYLINSSSLTGYDIKKSEMPIKVYSTLGGIKETIYPFHDKFVISDTYGNLDIYDFTIPDNPNYLSFLGNVYKCDQVVTDGTYVYISKNAERACREPAINQLKVMDFTNSFWPKVIGNYSLTSPFGLGLDGDKLWACDESAGLKLYDVSDKQSLKLTQTISNITPYDVIPLNGRLIVSAKEGIMQYDYSNIESIKFLSKIPISK